jgi:hypothetical protein
MSSLAHRTRGTIHFQNQQITSENIDLDDTQAWKVYISTFDDDWYQFHFDREKLRQPRGRHRHAESFDYTPTEVVKPVQWKRPNHMIGDVKVYIVREFATLRHKDKLKDLLRTFSRLCRNNATPIDEVC